MVITIRTRGQDAPPKTQEAPRQVGVHLYATPAELVIVSGRTVSISAALCGPCDQDPEVNFRNATITCPRCLHYMSHALRLALTDEQRAALDAEGFPARDTPTR